MIEQKPNLSVITVVCNESEGLNSTLNSTSGQDYMDKEIIVIDGGSGSGTIDIIRNFSDRISYWVSEPDQGIYHAMNKGIAKASGEWVIFMNAGDTFHHERVLSEIFSSCQANAEIIYGDAVFDYDRFKVLSKAGSLDDLWKGMICCHQSMFFRTSLIRSSGFSLAYAIGSDYEMVCRLHSAGKIFRKVSLPVCNWQVGGLSGRSQFRSLKERYVISKKHYKKALTGFCYYSWLFVLATLAITGTSILPKRVYLWIVKMRERNKLYKPGT